jgi:hypothetical protein
MTKKILFVVAAAFVLGSVEVSAQTYTYYSQSGRFVSSEGWETSCYAGRDTGHDGYDYRNRPQGQQMAFIGPLPAGAYYITGVDNHITADTIKLTPDSSNTMYGRDGFYIHGGGSNASRGCIVMQDGNRRVQIARAYSNSGSRYLTLYVYD